MKRTENEFADTNLRAEDMRNGNEHFQLEHAEEEYSKH